MEWFKKNYKHNMKVKRNFFINRVMSKLLYGLKDFINCDKREELDI